MRSPAAHPPRQRHGRARRSGSRVSIAYIALGANLGDRLGSLRRAIEELAKFSAIETVSSVYETVPVGFTDQPLYLNAVVRLRTDLPPQALLHVMLTIEAELGRVRLFPNAPRTLDLDLLFYDDRVIHTDSLTIPHPRAHGRAFVLMPLAEIASSLVHPVTGSTIDDLLAKLGSTSGVERWKPPSALIERT
jgi:2-amino-4-hydroxy-6-hydroxymethyldihydropteridine diphosphokinase